MRARHSALAADRTALGRREASSDLAEVGSARPRKHREADAPQPQPFPCPALGCSKGFGYKSVLKRHLKKVHGLDISAISVLSGASTATSGISTGSIATDDEEDDGITCGGGNTISECDFRDAPITCIEC